MPDHLRQSSSGGDDPDIASAPEAYPAEDLLKLIWPPDRNLRGLHQRRAQPHRPTFGQRSSPVHAGTLPHPRGQPRIANQLLGMRESVNGFDLGQQRSCRQIPDAGDRQ